MFDNIVITGANNIYYESLLTLISSIHKYAINQVDKVLVYDFGLDPTEIEHLKKLKLVEIITITEVFPVCEKITSIKIKSHFWKMYALQNSKKFGKNILWLDAGCCLIDNMSSIYEKLINDQIFVVGDYSHPNYNFTHSLCKTIMNVSEKEINDYQISSGIFGFVSDGKYDELINKSWDYTLIDGCIDGFYENHRHDQSILSILISRYDCPRQDIDIYGYWTDINRDLESAKNKGAVIFVHRRGYCDKTNLLYEN